MVCVTRRREYLPAPGRRRHTPRSGRTSMLRWRGPKESRGPVNRALLVYVANYYPGVALCDRPGAKRDAKKLHRTLTELGYQVALHCDPSGEEIHQLYRTAGREPVKDHFLTVLSSHGEEGCVFGADGAAVRLSHIFTYFDNQNMEEKTKLFLIQACRGNQVDDGVEVDLGGGGAGERSFVQHLFPPVESAVMYATAPGYGAFTHPLGSVFLLTFCSLLEDEDTRNLELTRLMTRLSHSVAYTFQARGGELAGKKMMPCLLMRLTKEVFPFAKVGEGGGASGLSATSLVDGVRTRTPSIS